MHQNTMEVEINKLKAEFNTIRYQYNSIEDQLVVLKEMVIKQRVEIDNLKKQLEVANSQIIELKNNV